MHKFFLIQSNYQPVLLRIQLNRLLDGLDADGAIDVDGVKPVHHAIGPRTIDSALKISSSFVNTQFPGFLWIEVWTLRVLWIELPSASVGGFFSVSLRKQASPCFGVEAG